MAKKNSITVDEVEVTELLKKMQRGDNKKTRRIYLSPEPEEMQKEEPTLPGMSPLVKSILKDLNGPKDSIQRLAFENDPNITTTFGGLFFSKVRLLPDDLLKRIAMQDDLVAAILQARQNHLSSFGRPRPDRFSNGFVIEPRKGITEEMDDKQKEELQDRIKKAVIKLSNCGETEGWDFHEKQTFSQFLSMTVRNVLTVGRLACEIIPQDDAGSDTKKFHSFRAVDAGTIYKATPQKDAQDQVREQAVKLLQDLQQDPAVKRNNRLDPQKFVKDEYAWVQVIQGRPVQAFTNKELLVNNFYEVLDVELDGYPVTPLDTMISAVTTHMNITTWNKLYFQHGRASKGMLVIHSDDVDENTIARIKQQFNASINSVSNAYRMPVFGVGADEEITWSPIDTGGRDMEFQYLMDMNARIILSAFSMSPDELPGWSYLSRGTNSQALSEGNQEYKLLAARDVGIRPLLQKFEDFIEMNILPLIDERVSQLCHFRLIGLDAETAEKESVRLQQDAAVHMTINEILERVEKNPMDKDLCGEFLLNPMWQALIDKYVTVGTIREKLLGIEGAAKDPAFQYIRDPFWLQWQQLQMQMQQMQQQVQMAQQQQQAQGQPQGAQGAPQGQESPEASGAAQGGSQATESPAGEGRVPGGQPSEPQPQAAMTENQKTAQVEQGAPQMDLSRGLDQAVAALTKSEKQLPPSRRRLLGQHKSMVERFLKGFEKDRDEAMKAIVAIVSEVAPQSKKE